MARQSPLGFPPGPDPTVTLPRSLVQQVEEAMKLAHGHCNELRDAWERGVMREGDALGRGGTRSNRNVDAEVALRYALKALQEGSR